MDFNLNDLSLKELRDLSAQVSKAIATFEDRRKKEAIAELEEKARTMGFSLAELTGVSVPKKRASAAAKYANPDNSAETWSGRGRKPRWFDAALKSSAKPEDMSV